METSKKLTPAQQKWYDDEIEKWDQKKVDGYRVAIPHGLLFEKALAIN